MALAYCQASQSVSIQIQFPDLFGIGNNNFLGLPILFWVMLICVIVGTFILRKTKLGRHTLALGNSEAASEISGINME